VNDDKHNIEKVRTLLAQAPGGGWLSHEFLSRSVPGAALVRALAALEIESFRNPRGMFVRLRTARHREPTILVRGEPLSEAHAMSLRVAVSSFLWELRTGEAEVLGPIGPLYIERLAEIERMLVTEEKP